MNYKQNAKLNMAQWVYETMMQHENLYGKILPIAQVVALLGTDITKLDSTLYDKLDKMMVLFKKTVSNFYEASYRTSRNIIYN